MKLRTFIWIPLAALLAGCGESTSERAAREAREAEELQLLLGLAGAWQSGPQRQAQPAMNLDYEWQAKQRVLQNRQGQQRWNVYDANGDRVGRIEPNYSAY